MCLRTGQRQYSRRLIMYLIASDSLVSLIFLLTVAVQDENIPINDPGGELCEAQVLILMLLRCICAEPCSLYMAPYNPFTVCAVATCVL
jgi:hypothetical protein